MRGIVGTTSVAQCNTAYGAPGACRERCTGRGRVVSVWEIRAEHGESRYGAFVGDELVGQAACVRIGDAVAVPHIQVDAAFRGLGIGTDLARSICTDARGQGLRVLALCPFMHRWGHLHPQYGEVLHTALASELDAITPFVGAAEFHQERRLQARIGGRAHR